MWIRFSGGWGRHFRKTEFQESTEYLKNPGCGWYHVYTFTARPPEDGRPVKEEVWLDDACQREQLALALIDIGDFRLTPLSEAALLHIGQIMEFFHENQKQLLLRFVYDTEGKGMQKDPLTFGMVKRHMEQIGGAIRPYLENILVVQGIFVGNWGEMHGSRFLDDTSICELIDTLYRITEGRCFLAVRTPAQWRKITESPKTRPEMKTKLALFNDGIFGSPTDLGTYGTMARAEAGETGNWSREEELEWQNLHMRFVPNGGEALAGPVMTGYAEAAGNMMKMHLSYLNSVYQPEQLEYWKQESVTLPGCWAGVNGYDYIGCHLGYRFVLRDVCLKSGRKLRLTVENCGFASLCEEADCWLTIEREGREESCRRVETDAREWRSGTMTILETELPEVQCEGCRMLFLRLVRRADGQSIRFANQGAEEKILIGELLTSKFPTK